MKQQKEHKNLLENLKKGDKVITSGGIHGTIAGFKAKNTVIILAVDKNVKFDINRTAISGLISKEVSG
tara:strand:- start:31154 stop:31357 length:204 start_codon:yes stop_codon:yes gene_type:complete